LPAFDVTSITGLVEVGEALIELVVLDDGHLAREARHLLVGRAAVVEQIEDVQPVARQRHRQDVLGAVALQRIVVDAVRARAREAQRDGRHVLDRELLPALDVEQQVERGMEERHARIRLDGELHDAVVGVPRSLVMCSGEALRLKAPNTVWPESKMLIGPPKPCCARSAAVTPLRAARPI
jgi:hypothetical protein